MTSSLPPTLPPKSPPIRTATSLLSHITSPISGPISRAKSRLSSSFIAKLREKRPKFLSSLYASNPNHFSIPYILLIILHSILALALLYNLFTIPYVVAFERHWHIGLLITNIALDVIYALGVCLTEGRLFASFFVVLWGKHAMHLVNRLAFLVCCCGCVPEFRKTLVPRFQKWRQRREMMQRSRKIRGIVGRNSQRQLAHNDEVSEAHNDDLSVVSSAPPPAETAPKKPQISQEFKEQFVDAWDNHMRKFLKNYLFTHKFIADVILLIPIDWFFIDHPWLRLAKFCASVIRFSSQYEFGLTALNVKKSTMGLMRLPFLVAMLCHIFACAYFFVTDIRVGRWGTSGFIAPDPFKVATLREVCMSRTIDFMYGSQRFRQYNCSLVSAMIFLAGYHDVSVPHNIYQAIFSVTYTLAGSLIFATMVGTVSALMQSRDLTSAMYQEKLENMKGFMRERKVSPWLRRTVTRYYSILRNTRRDISAQEVFHDLDADLYRKISQSLYYNMIMKVELFSKVENPFFVGDICQTLHYVLVLDGISIILEGDVGVRMFFIHSGQIEMYGTDANGKEIVYCVLGPGMLFGDAAIVSEGQKRMASFRAKSSIVELFALSYNEFYLVLEKYPDIKPKIYELLKDRKRKSDLMMAKLRRNNDIHNRSGRGLKNLLRIDKESTKSQKDMLRAQRLHDTIRQVSRRRSHSVSGPPSSPPAYNNFDTARHQTRGPKRNLTIKIPATHTGVVTPVFHDLPLNTRSTTTSHTGFTPLLGNVRREEIDFPTPSPDRTPAIQAPSTVQPETATPPSSGADSQQPLLSQQRPTSTTSDLISPVFSPSIATIEPDPMERIAELHRIMGSSSQNKSPQSMTQRRKVRRVFPAAEKSPVPEGSRTSLNAERFNQDDSSPIPVTTVTLRRERLARSPSARDPPASPSSPGKKKKRKKLRQLPPVSGTATRHVPISPLGGLPPLGVSPTRTLDDTRLSPLSRSFPGFSPSSGSESSPATPISPSPAQPRDSKQ